MQSALRPYVTTGVALVGATALAVTPLLVTPEVQLHPAPLTSVSRDLHLTSIATDFAAAVNAVINGFVGTGVEGVTIFNDALEGGTLWLQEGVGLGSTLLGAAVSYPFDAAKLISGGFLTAMTDVFGVNPITSGIADIVNGFVGPAGAGEIIAAALRSGITTGAGVVSNLIGFGTAVLAQTVDIPVGVLAQVVTGFQHALTDLATGDTAAALDDIVAGFTGAFGVVTTGLTNLFNSGVQLFNSLVQAGTTALNLAIQTPIAAGTAIVNGFINAFTGVVPTLAGTQVQTNNTPLGAASFAPDTSVTDTSTFTTKKPLTTDTLTPKATASLVPSLPKRTAPNLPSASSTTAGDVTGSISGGLTGVDLGADVSAKASGGKSQAGTSTTGSTAGVEHSSPTAKRVAPHFGGTNPGKGKKAPAGSGA